MVAPITDKFMSMLSDGSLVDMSSPVSDDALNDDLQMWVMTLPGFRGSSWLDLSTLSGRSDISNGTLISVSNPADNWSFGHHPGGYGHLTLDGTSEYVNFSGYKGVGGTRAHTTTIWFNTTSTNTEDNALVSWGGNDKNEPGAGWNITIEDGTIWERSFVGVTGTWEGGFNDGDWHNLIMTFPAGGVMSDVRAYVDGNELSGTFGNGSTSLDISPDSDVKIGEVSEHIAGGWLFDGLVDNVRIYNGRELDSNQVGNLYEQDLRFNPRLLRRIRTTRYFTLSVSSGPFGHRLNPNPGNNGWIIRPS